MPFDRVMRAGLCLVLGVLLAASAHAQQFSKEQIDSLTAQVALYPDALLSQVLMASTYPSDVTAAAKWSREHPDAKGDAAVKQVESYNWDPSVASLVATPQVIVTMGENPQWVQDLGDAFLSQPEDVMDSVQRLRAQAQKAGNLQSNQDIKVSVESAPPPEVRVTVAQQAPPPQVIVIEPARPEVIFVPTYNPVVVYGPWMYPAFPPIYVPPPPGYWWSVAIGTGIAWGVSWAVRDALWGGCNWWRRDVNININRYNNININRRIDVNTTRQKWAHDTRHRGAVPYRGGEATKQQLARRADTVKRDNYRGRAEATMRDKGIAVDAAATRDPARPQTRERPTPATRDTAKPATREPSRPATRETPKPATRDQVAARDRDQARAELQRMNRDNALRGVGTRDLRPQIDRGMASRDSMQKHQRPQTRPTARPQPQTRPQTRPQARPQTRPQARPQVRR